MKKVVRSPWWLGGRLILSAVLWALIAWAFIAAISG